MENTLSLIQHYLSIILFYLPIGIIGVWRWLTWIIKKAIGSFYKVKRNNFKATVSIITPVYNEDPNIFKKALFSWAENKPFQIVAVIDYTDKQSIEIFRKFAKTYPRTHLIITKKPGKRAALADGIKVAKGELVALVDSDTLWTETVLQNSLPPFIDPKVAGVTTRQNVLRTDTLAQKMFDILLDLRYHVDFTFLAAAGDALVCLSGRTAIYRRSVVLPLCHDLVNETFMGKPVISGDDKRLTYLVLEQGWKVAYQKNARVYTPGMVDLKSYLKQRLRWTRNSLRADLRAIFQGWPFRHPALAFYQIDKVVQAFAIILSPIYFFLSLYLGLYLGAALILIWWFVSRAIKIYPHLRRKPSHITLLPFYVLYTFISAFLKIYALFTLNTQSWITRWDKSRLPQFKFLNYVPAYAMSAILLLVLTSIVYSQKTGLTLPKPNTQPAQVLQAAYVQSENIVLDSNIKLEQVRELDSKTYINDNGLLVKKYVVKEGDILSGIAVSFDTDVEDILEANLNILPNWNRIEPGTVLSIPYQQFSLESPHTNSYTIKKLTEVDITYDKEDNTIHVFGRGNPIKLADLAKKLGNDKIEQIKPKEWLLKANLKIEKGVSLNLNKDEVEWLKLKSEPGNFVSIRTWGGNVYIDGVKISSWDTTKNDYDKKDTDGRSFIMAKYSSRMDIINSDLGYLGFYPHSSKDGSSYGVSWKLPDGTAGKYFVTGEVKNSKFHHNYFGAYTYGAVGMVWQGNEFYDNIQYGLDPHDDSNGFLVENNTFHDNGNHGIIFSKRCINNIIRNNLSYNNKLHGIMLDRDSNNNIVENNTVYGNKDGIALYDSSNNVVKNNKIYGNQRGLRANTKSQKNQISENDFTRNKQYGVYLYGQADSNIISNNSFDQNKIAVYIKTDSNQINDNNITHNNVGVYFIDDASDNKVANNTIKQNQNYGIYSKTFKGTKNLLGKNDLSGNGNDIFAISINPSLSKL
ncbi:right-handed parallel beta-helix repeat-containing protein [Candidatus Daviesbacteria bacterium]|nr:right-handed parallel beta-helix repeat-containing protein [Candidatus Daviesbacteria bacterium]